MTIAMSTRADDADRGMRVPTADQRIVMACDWDAYEVQLALRGERSRPKLAYLDGELELMSPSNDHERIQSKIGTVIDAYLVCADLDGARNGGPTLRRRRANAGAEPDESYSFGVDPDLEDNEVPDLVIEVNWTRGGIDKLEIYRRLGVREVWFWEAGAIAIHVLGKSGYAVQPRSTFLPELDLDLVVRLIELKSVREIHAAMRAALTK
jgi:Uma2 family endonuclease